jgi:GntR family transcriptional regulator
MGRRAPKDVRPLPVQARDAVLNLIEEGGYQPGDKLLSERELAKQLNVSRPTIRETLRVLEEEGRIIRQVGVGTFVGQFPVVESGMETLTSFTEMMAQSGHEAGTSYLSASEGEFTDSEAELFQATAGAPKIVVERVRTLDGHPAMYSVHVCPKAYVGGLPPEAYSGSIFALIEKRSGLLLSHSDTRLSSTLAGDKIGSMLGLPADTPLLVLDEVVISTDNRVLCTSLSYFRADMYRYRIVRRRPEANQSV